MNRTVLFILVSSLVLFSCNREDKELNRIIEHGLQIAKIQSLNMAKTLEGQEGRLPKTLDKQGNPVTSDSHWWCSGFFPGVLWYLYENDKDETLLKYAELYSDRVEDQKFTTDNHDVGFIMNCSFGNGERITGCQRYKDILITGAKSLSTRFNPNIGVIRSWDRNGDMWQYPVIIDNMMNLELMMKVAGYTHNQEFKKIAESHADVTLRNHFRNDGSSYHVVSYDTITARPHLKQTWQGFGDESAWARGQAWALYGYTMMYRETGLQRYLEQAQKVAEFILTHPNFPENKIPYWDFDDVKIPNAKRDASAAAIMSSALIELSGFVNKDLSRKYLDVAKIQITTLSSPEYLAEPGTNGNFILKHSVGALPKDSEVDVPLTYADYYYVEALLRLKNKLGNPNLTAKL